MRQFLSTPHLRFARLTGGLGERAKALVSDYCGRNLAQYDYTFDIRLAHLFICR